MAVAGIVVAAGCGTQGVSVPKTDPTHDGAEIFAQRCGGCHTLTPAGTEGSGNRSQRQQGPNLDQRTETVNDVIYAIRNGGFSGAIMPQNIVVGADAQEVAAFVAKYAGGSVVRAPGPQATTTTAAPGAP